MPWLCVTFSGRKAGVPARENASIIIDDPLLRPNYGFLNFEYLLGLMKRHNFQTTVAFIPHNFRRNSRRVTRMFRGNDAYFGLCFHGNDHTGGEFASTDTALLNTMLHIAEQRMKLHRNITGLECDRIMVFPQGRFSVEAMAVLRSRNFDAAVNTVSTPGSSRPGSLSVSKSLNLPCFAMLVFHCSCVRTAFTPKVQT